MNTSKQRLAVLVNHLAATTHTPPRVHGTYDDGLVIRDMTRSDITTVMSWFSGFESQCVHDLDITLDVFGKAENAYFVVGEKDGELVGAYVAIPWTPTVCYAGYFYVVEKYRSHGYSKLIVACSGHKLEGKAIIASDSIPGLGRLSLRSKEFYQDFTVDVFDGIPVIPTTVLAAESTTTNQTTIRVVPYTEVEWAKVVQYFDAHFCLVDNANAHLRHEFLARWCAIDGGRALVALHGDRVVGLGCRRPCVRDHQIGPLYADSEQAAEMLMGGLCSGLSRSETVTLYVSDQNKKSVQLMKKFGLEIKEEYIRVYTYGKLEPLKDDVYIFTSADVCGF